MVVQIAAVLCCRTLEHTVHRRIGLQADMLVLQGLAEGKRIALGQRMAGMDGKRELVLVLKPALEALEIGIPSRRRLRRGHRERRGRFRSKALPRYPP